MSVQSIVTDFVAKLQSDNRTIDIHTNGNSTVLLHLTEIGVTRVSLIAPYVNKAGRNQISWFVSDFSDEDKALELYLHVVEYDCFLVFGNEFRLSSGSGFRFYKNWD